jgi:hypothetical protein
MFYFGNTTLMSSERASGAVLEPLIVEAKLCDKLHLIGIVTKEN